MSKGMTRVLSLICMAALLLLSACGQESKQAQGEAKSGAPENSAETIKVGAVFSLTGPNSPLGMPEKQAVELLAKKINENGGVNGKKIEMKIEDDKSDNTEAVKAVKKLAKTDGVLAVLGSSGSGPSLGMAKFAEDEKLPMISMAAADEITNPVRAGIFKTPHTDIHGTKRIYTFLKEKNMTSIAVLYDSNPYGSGWAKQLKAFASEYGITIVAEEKYGTKDNSMSTQLTKIKGSGASALIIAGTNPGPSTIVKEAKQLGLTIPIISSHGSANNKFIELAGEAAEGVYMLAGKLLVPDQLKAEDPQTKVIKEFVEAYKKEYNSIPDGFAGYAYDGLNILAEGLKATNGDASKLNDALRSLKHVGVTGEFVFSEKDHNGLSETSMVILQVKDGKFQLVP
ncbi:ABC transporter substrate-binding protein [Aneurinibacillus sp. REN35]|uniref:ABC transporter substrate-binding protein n=1 Tax=Aneurinibacillus sp. REN35 TaxID=3237286 RepID=UPI0035290DB6